MKPSQPRADPDPSTQELEATGEGDGLRIEARASRGSFLIGNISCGYQY